jgi:hypothetical protein
MRTTCTSGFLANTAMILFTAGHAHGQLVTYEPSWGVFPEKQSWERLAYCEPSRWLDDGWLVQHVDFTHCNPQPNFEIDRYRQSFPSLTGATTFFLEWESRTDGSVEELVYSAPSTIGAFSNLGAVNYHFTISDQRVRFIRDVNDLPTVWVDIDPTVSHVHRLEHYNDPPLWYVWTIDGMVVDEGTPEGPFPSTNPTFYGVCSFSASSWLESSTTRWRYVRAGEIPLAGSLDFTNDGLIDHLDYYLFRDYLSGPDAPHARGWSVGDADEDSDIDLHDFAAMQNHFTGGE